MYLFIYYQVYKCLPYVGANSYYEIIIMPFFFTQAISIKFVYHCCLQFVELTNLPARATCVSTVNTSVIKLVTVRMARMNCPVVTMNKLAKTLKDMDQAAKAEHSSQNFFHGLGIYFSISTEFCIMLLLL